MIVENCKYNEERDNTPVSQYGFIDLVEAVNNGAVPTYLSDTEVAYNDIEDPESILGKPRDVFEAYRMQDYVKNAGTKKDESTE